MPHRRVAFSCIAFLLAAGAAALSAQAPRAAPTLDGALALHQAGRLREALSAYHALAAGTTDPLVAAPARNNACLLQMDLGDSRSALPDCREALRLLRAQGDSAAIGRALNNLGLAQEMLGDTAAAERSYREALDLNRRGGDAEGQVINLGNLGALASTAGRYAPALALHTEAAALATRNAGTPWATEQLQIARINQGVVLEKLGAYREALDLYRGALDAGGTEGTVLEPRRRAALLVNTGVLYRNLGDPVRAVAAFRAAIATYGGLGDGAALSNAWLNLALAQHLNLERPVEAEVSFREALRLAVASGDRTEEIQDLFYLGRLLLTAPVGTSRLDEAAELFRRCLAGAQASGSAEGTWSAREGLGRIAAARGDLRGALTELEAALAEIEKVRAGLTRGEQREGWFGGKRSVYAATVAVLDELARRQTGPAGENAWAERALETVQRAKARELLDTLGIPGGGTPSAADLRARAGDGTILEYFLGETDLYRWTITRESIRMASLGPSAPVLAAIARVHRALAHGGAPTQGDLLALSRTLLEPGAPLELPLRIAPDGRLHYLPFELLDDPASPGAPLVDRAAVVYLPSASTLAAPGAAEKPAGDRLAGFADPVLPGLGAAASGLPTPTGLLVERFGLAHLPSAGGELTTAAHLLGGRADLFTGVHATEESFRAALHRGARVVHLATHTVVDERPGRGAAILLSPAGEDDGLLTPNEIARQTIPSGVLDLTVLAACRTALSNGSGGGGNNDGGALASLTGAFLAAGSRGVVATLWDVDDAATAAFMEQLYDRLGRGDPPAEALQRAKQRLRADPRWNRPSLWAGYVLIGEAPPVAPRRSGGWWIGAALLAVTAVLIGIWAFSTRRRPSRPSS